MAPSSNDYGPVQWQPISMLPTLAAMVDEMHKSTQHQLQLLGRARERPYAFDAATVERVRRVYSEQAHFLVIYAEQFVRWQGGRLNAAQRREVARIAALVEEGQRWTAKILALAEVLIGGTIDAVMRKSDAQLGLEALLGRELDAAPPPRPAPLVLNQLFVQDLLAATPPCFAVGYVEVEGMVTGFIAMRPARAIPAASTDQGFRFGHAIVGNAACQLMQFSFEFYGHATYHGLADPGSPIVRAVVDRMLETRDYFFFAINPDQSAVAFRSHLEDADLGGLRTNRARFADAHCPPEQYDQSVQAFARNPVPPGQMLSWVCRDNPAYLDLTAHRMEVGPQ